MLLYHCICDSVLVAYRRSSFYNFNMPASSALFHFLVVFISILVAIWYFIPQGHLDIELNDVGRKQAAAVSFSNSEDLVFLPKLFRLLDKLSSYFSEGSSQTIQGA